MSLSQQRRAKPDDNVVTRLQQRLGEARRAGFQIRMELLDGQQATWCEIAGCPTLFVDLSQTAAEQLQQVDEALRSYRGEHSVPVSDTTSSPRAA